MGYFTIPTGATGHQHANKTVLDALQDAGSGTVITEAERTSLGGAFTAPPESDIIWDGNPPPTVLDALERLSVFVATRCKLEPKPKRQA